MKDNLRLLSAFQFTPVGQECLWSGSLNFVSWKDAIAADRHAIFIPTDVPAPLWPDAVRKVAFNGTQLTLWNAIEQPAKGWRAVPDPNAPLFWQKGDNGPLIPAWNIFATLADLQAFREEREIAVYDVHARFAIESSPRFAQNLTAVPFANEALAVLLAAALSIRSGQVFQSSLPAGFVAVPSLALSHDCDVLNGGDLLTQAIRIFRFLLPMARARLPVLPPLRGVIENLLHPRRYYFDNMAGMFDLERQFGVRSISYILNGRGGRFGARTPSRLNREFVREVPNGWAVGLHYNYGSMDDPSMFDSQKRQAELWAGHALNAGRAHYLRFDPLIGFRFLSQHGIDYDESVGWPYQGSYRCGIAGPFRPWDHASRAPSEVIEMPMTIMDAGLPGQTNDPASFAALYRHLTCIGGTLSILIHPGIFFNPEFEYFIGIYHGILGQHFEGGGRYVLPVDVLAVAKQILSLQQGAI